MPHHLHTPVPPVAPPPLCLSFVAVQVEHWREAQGMKGFQGWDWTSRWTACSSSLGPSTLALAWNSTAWSLELPSRQIRALASSTFTMSRCSLAKTPTGVGSLPSSTSSRTLKGTRQSIVLDSIVLDNVPVLVELHHLVHLLPPEEGGQLVSRDTAPGLLTVQLSRWAPCHDLVQQVWSMLSERSQELRPWPF